MIEFNIYPVIEYRTDDPTWIMYRVQLQGKDYLIAYSQDKLKEVYFIGEGYGDYFMSVRADNIEQISHYKVDGRKITRYEQGKPNRTYHEDEQGNTYCLTHQYYRKLMTERPNPEKLYNDLAKFLQTWGDRPITKPPYIK